jgi:hypothetical protein
MSPEEALKYGRLYEPLPHGDPVLFDSAAYFRSRGTVVVMTLIPATNPAHEHGSSDKHHQEAIEFSRSGRIIQKVL